MRRPRVATGLLIGAAAGLTVWSTYAAGELGQAALIVLGRTLRLVGIAAYGLGAITLAGYWCARSIAPAVVEPASAPRGYRLGSVLVACLTFGSAIVVLVSVALLASGWYDPAILVVLAHLTVALSVLAVVRAGGRPLPLLWRESKAALAELGRLDFFGWAVVVVVAAAGLYATAPPDTRDELAYHLVIPQSWSIEGSWHTATGNAHWLFPGNVEAIWGYAMALGGLRVPRLFTWLFAVVTVCLLASIARSSGVGRYARSVSLVFLLATPVALAAFPVNYVEWPLVLFVLVGWWALQRSREAHREPDSRPATGSWLVLTGCAWGLAAGTKYTALAVVVVLALEAVFQGVRLGTPNEPEVTGVTSRANLQLLLAVFVGTALLAGPWLVRNTLLTGDPVHPLGGSLLPWVASTTEGAASFDVDGLLDFAEVPPAWRWAPWLYHATLEQLADHRMHLGWPLLLAGVVLFGWRQWRRLPWLTVLVLSLLFFRHSPAPRIFLPLMLLTWLFLPAVVDDLSRDRVVRLVVSLWAFLVLLVGVHTTAAYALFTYERNVQNYLMGLAAADVSLELDGVTTPAVRWVRERTNPAARLWVWCEDKVLYFERAVIASSYLDEPAHHRLARTGQLDAFVESERIDFVVVNVQACPETVGGKPRTDSRWLPSVKEQQAVAAWIRDRLEPVFRDDRFVVFRPTAPGP